MNQKTSKLIRQTIPAWREREYEVRLVKSKRGAVKRQDTGEVFANTALQARLKAGCPRDLYKRTKLYVSANRL